MVCLPEPVDGGRGRTGIPRQGRARGTGCCGTTTGAGVGTITSGPWRMGGIGETCVGPRGAKVSPVDCGGGGGGAGMVTVVTDSRINPPPNTLPWTELWPDPVMRASQAVRSVGG